MRHAIKQATTFFMLYSSFTACASSSGRKSIVVTLR
ncbi:hypothetical protein [Sphingobacterium pedocola]